MFNQRATRRRWCSASVSLHLKDWIMGIGYIELRYGASFFPTVCKSGNSGAEAQRTQSALLSQFATLNLERGFLERTKHRIDSSLVARPLCSKPFQNVRIDSKRDRCFGRDGF